MSSAETSGRRAKRPRPSPSPSPLSHLTRFPSSSDLASRLRSNDDDARVSALNDMLRATSEAESNYALGPGGDAVVNALVSCFDETIGWVSTDDDEDEDDEEGSTPPVSRAWDESNRAWVAHCRTKFASPTHDTSIPPAALLDPDVDGRILDVLLVVLRNLSYVAHNLRYLAHNVGVLRLLTGCLYYRAFDARRSGGGGGGGGAGGGIGFGDDLEGAGAGPSNNSNVCLHAVHTLINLAPHIDPTGRKVFVDRMFLSPDSGKDAKALSAVVSSDGYGIAPSLGFGGLLLAKRYDAREGTFRGIPDDVVLGDGGKRRRRGLGQGSVRRYVRTVLSLYPALLCLLDPTDGKAPPNRPSVAAALELLKELVEHASGDDDAIFLSVPDALLHHLVSFLYVPRLGPDSIEYVDPTMAMVSRVSALKLLGGYDTSIDYDLRDRAAELLVKLAGLSPALKTRLGRAPSRNLRSGRSDDARGTVENESPSSEAAVAGTSSRRHRINVRLYDSILPMLTTKAGRGDAPKLASNLLAALAVVPENKAGMMYVERRLVGRAACDPHVANVACNGVLNQF